MTIDEVNTEVDKLLARLDALVGQINFLEKKLDIARRNAESPDTRKRGKPAGSPPSICIRDADNYN